MRANTTNYLVKHGALLLAMAAIMAILAVMSTSVASASPPSPCPGNGLLDYVRTSSQIQYDRNQDGRICLYEKPKGSFVTHDNKYL